MKKLFIIVNHDWFFLSHRKDIALAAKDAGWDVTIVALDTGDRKKIEDLGLKFINLPLNSTGKRLIHELKTFRFLNSLYSKNRDAIFHHVGLKIILWGNLAARHNNVKGVVNAVSGLGILFDNEQSLMGRVVLKFIKWGMNRDKVRIIFQNHDDERVMMSHGVISPGQKVYIKGSGIDLDDYAFVPMPSSGKIKIAFTGRMIEEKGVRVVIEAAAKLKDKYKDSVEFLLIGDVHPNPKTLSKEELKSYCDGTYIQWLGFRNDVKDLLAESSIVVLPSYYREGLPKSLIEANAIGRPIVTTDSVGCRDTVEDGVNGFLIPIKDSDALAEKLEILINDYDLRVRMGKEARRIAERDFSIKNVVKKHMEIYNELDRQTRPLK